MALEDKRVPVLLGTHNINTYDSEGAVIRTEAKAVALMTQRVRAGLDFEEATAAQLQGIEIETADNGSYFSEVQGSVSAQIVTVIRSELSENDNNLTYSFSVPRFFPNYKLKSILSGKGDAIAFKRNGKRIFLG